MQLKHAEYRRLSRDRAVVALQREAVETIKLLGVPVEVDRLAWATPSVPSIIYSGPVTPRDARKVPWMQPRANCHGAKPFH
jgi:hypothetical protein